MSGASETAADQPDLRAQVKSLIFGTLLVDPDLTITDINPAAETLFGQSASRLVGQKLLEQLKIEDERIVTALKQADAQMIARELRVVMSDMEQVINLTMSPISGHAGWLVLTLTDTQDNELTNNSSSSSGNLKAPAILAHEIKNPLAGIRGASQLLRRRIDPQHHDLTNMIIGEVDRVSALLDSMQKLSSEKVDEPAECNLHEAIHHACGVVTSADQSSFELAEEYDPSLPPVFVNRDALVQVLINLVANARDACASKDAPKVTIRTRFVSGQMLSAFRLGRRTHLPIEVLVKDNGDGIDPALNDHIFEPFVSSKPQGQGLGLALVAKLIREMNGRINYSRDEKAGETHFKLNLPIVPKETAK